MEIRRVFVDHLKMKNGLAVIAGPMHKYVVTVLRKREGDRIDLIDGNGYLYRCSIGAAGNKELALQIREVVREPDEKRPKVTLCVSPIKGPRMDWLVEKATELGVNRILPTIFTRTLIKLDESARTRCDRWKRITIEAARQSGRFTVPEVLTPTPVRGLMSLVGHVKDRIVLYEKESERTLKTFFSSNRGDEVCIVIGPEGGIDDGEIDWLNENGFVSYSLGENVFRSETTPLVVLSIFHYEMSTNRK